MKALWIFQFYTIHYQKKSRVEQVPKLFFTDGTTRTHFTDIKPQFYCVNEKGEKY